MHRQSAQSIREPGSLISIRKKALALPGVLAVLTADDVPNNKVGHLQQDWDVMISKGSITRCVGDAICLVVAETRESLEKAKKLIKIDYEEFKARYFDRRSKGRGRARTCTLKAISARAAM